MKCGLLGRVLIHSYSPAIHKQLGDYSFELFEVEPENLEQFVKHGDYDGINVTLPYKKAVIPFLDELTPAAQSLGAVNTIVRRKDGTLLGHNTDRFGFVYQLQESGLDVKGKKCLVLGTGGASASAISVLNEMGANVVIISRSGENNYNNLHLHSDARLIVNATPLGMYPDVGESALELTPFPELEGVFDFIYNPARTKILLDAMDRGIVASNGLALLVAQAKESAEYFTGKTIPDGKIEEIVRHFKRKMQNVILIGMPGCGKSTVANAISQKFGRKWIDVDREIEKLAGKSILQIFEQDGEKAFREMETQVLATFGKESNLVISTGGGCVTVPENFRHLKQNGVIFWLRRSLDRLPTEGRPLSNVQTLEDMFTHRKPMYQDFADVEVSNNGTVQETVDQIEDYMEGVR